MSRFKVSVVTEPDRSKLIIPDKKDADRRESTTSSRDKNETKKENDYTQVINKTFDSLKTTLVQSLPKSKLNY